MKPDSAPSPVIVYWRPGCLYCFALRRRLRQLGVATTEINIWDDSDAASLVRAHANGCETVPTVAIGTTVMVNPTGLAVLDAARRLAPSALHPEDVVSRDGRFRPISGLRNRLACLVKPSGHRRRV